MNKNLCKKSLTTADLGNEQESRNRHNCLSCCDQTRKQDEQLLQKLMREMKVQAD